MKFFIVSTSLLFIIGGMNSNLYSSSIANASMRLDKSDQLNNIVSDSSLLTPSVTNHIALLGQIWGFIKYHDSGISGENYDIDEELIGLVKEVMSSEDDVRFNKVLWKWVRKFNLPSVCKNCDLPPKEEIAILPDYGMIFTSPVLSDSIQSRLRFIATNYNGQSNMYVGFNKVAGNPIFTNEKPYEDMKYPSMAYRLLALFRYWNMVQYYYPYKKLIDNDWVDVLIRMIPEFISAKNSQDYVRSLLHLTASINDSHANLGAGSGALEKLRGLYSMPFQAKFFGDTLVVTGYYNDTLNIKQLVKVGDIIQTIDGIDVKSLIASYLPITAGSNRVTQLRNMVRHNLLRSNHSVVKVGIFKNDTTAIVNVPTIDYNSINSILDYNTTSCNTSYQILDNNIGYIFPGKYKNHDLPAIKNAMSKTKGMIIDMRSYPYESMAFTFVPFVKNGKLPFIKFARSSPNKPGLFVLSEPFGVRGSGRYKGKIVVIVNEFTQSKAEYTTMALQASPNVVVIGSTTAGADGDVAPIVLPSGLTTWISSIGIIYPDNTQTQRKGVKINYIVKPTIAGLKAGHDELLDSAIKLISSNNP